MVERSKLPSGFGNYSFPTHLNCRSERGLGSLEGCIGLPALQLVPLGLAWAERGMGILYICIPGL